MCNLLQTHKTLAYTAPIVCSLMAKSAAANSHALIMEQNVIMTILVVGEKPHVLQVPDSDRTRGSQLLCELQRHGK